jgi:hypothetical protein
MKKWDIIAFGMMGAGCLMGAVDWLINGGWNWLTGVGLTNGLGAGAGILVVIGVAIYLIDP